MRQGYKNMRNKKSEMQKIFEVCFLPGKAEYTKCQSKRRI